jgi:pyruvate,orthophosphate dikinase
MTLDEKLPKAFAHLSTLQKQLELHFRDMQDIEFTIEKGKLYLLQTRTGKRTPAAAVQIVVDLVNEGVITVDEALQRIDAGTLEMVLRPVLDPDAPRKVLAKGLDASPGAAAGKVVFHSEDAQEMSSRGERVVLVRNETSPEDIQGMTAAEGILTARGGQTSHAAVVARSMGKPCVVGCSDIVVDYARQLFYAGDAVIRRGDVITIDGASGMVMEGEIPMLMPPTESGSMHQLLLWADERARLTVRANADNAHDATRARSLGATGIGLCRTEHMFFQPDALRAMRQMILAEDSHSRLRALAHVLPLQRDGFAELFRVMDGLPVTIRLLDPPLHEFLPSREEDVEAVAADLGIRASALRHRLEALEEANPMLGHRGCRIGITTPEIYAVQVRAIIEAACIVAAEGFEVLPEIMIPLVALDTELRICRDQVLEVASKILDERGTSIEFKVGTMIEVPRAALTAGSIAEYADFFSFGTNDLTQLTYGFSRDDMGKFLPAYLRARVLEDSPLSVFDEEGVGELVRMASIAGKKRKAQLKIGVCGEHGGDPRGVRFFHSLPVDYVSCSPFRVPVARLCAAQAVLEAEER